MRKKNNEAQANFPGSYKKEFIHNNPPSHNQKANRGGRVCKYEQSTLNSPFRGLTESSLPILKDEYSKQPKRQFSLSHLENIFSGFLAQFCIKSVDKFKYSGTDKYRY